MDPSLISGAVTGGLGLLGGGIEYAMGAYARHKAEQAAKGNIRPTYQTPQSESYLTNLIQSQGTTGMSDASRAAYLNNAGEGLGTTINAIQKGGGDPNAIGNAYSNYQKGINSMALYDDSQRMQHLNAIAQNYTRQSANTDKEFQLNKFDPYKDRAQAIAQQLQSAQQRQTAGLNTMLGGLGSIGQGVASGMSNRIAPQGGGNNGNQTNYPSVFNNGGEGLWAGDGNSGYGFESNYNV